MKKYLVLLLSFAIISYTGVAQVQATIKPGSQVNSVYVAFKSSVTLTAAKFSTFQFAVGVPASQSTGVVATVNSLDPLMSYVPATSTEVQDGVSYLVFSFSGDGAQSGTGTTFTAGVEYNYAEVFFTGANVILTDVRIMQIPNGGAAGLVNFYVANMGTDVTNLAAQFYSLLPVNFSNDGNNYIGSSWARVGPIVLPVKFLGFNVAKKNNDAMLTWQIENESALTDRYEIERSLNGVDFKKVYTVPAKNNGSTSNSYELADLNLTSIRSAGVIYYRIQQYDKDGRSITTPIKSLRLDGRSLAVSVYPNPIKNFANVSIDLVEDARVMLTINDVSGKQVQTMPLQLIKGINVKKVNMSGLAAGSYMLQVNTGTETKTIPLVKAN